METKNCPACGGKLQHMHTVLLDPHLLSGELFRTPAELYVCDACGRYEFYKPQEVCDTDAEDRAWLKEFNEKVAAGLITKTPFVCPSCGSMRRDRVCPVCGCMMDLKTMTVVDK